jgi:hypothetical protein
MYLIAFPLLLIPFALYNMVAFLLNMPFSETVFSVPLGSDRRMPLNVGDLLVAIGMLLLYIEVLKAARFGGKGVTDHILSFVLFVAMVSELALVPQASTSSLLLLAVLGFVDFITGISLSIRRKQRAIVVEGANRGV